MDRTDSDPCDSKAHIHRNGGMSESVCHDNVDDHVDIPLFDDRDRGRDNNQNGQKGTESVHGTESTRSRKLHDRFHRAYEKATSEDYSQRSLVDRSTLAWDKPPGAHDEKKGNEKERADHRNKAQVRHLTGDPVQGRRETRDGGA